MLQPGSRFGVFEVQSRVGSGGMGEVFRATDTRLGRPVALKVLRTALDANPEHLDRFNREARALAALNHIGIAAIYDTVESDGVRALVLEFVEGETLEERVRRGPLPIREAITIARAIAESLDAAHERGLVHRDLKPANVKITPAGDVKLLDFGIARMLVGLDGHDAATAAGTERGVVIGTAAYMSPEQARGHAVDKRTDVWAFGCVLYEMLTGRAVFRGETWSDSVARTLTGEPDWKALPPQTPPGIIRVLQRCLDKDPKQRLRGLGGIELALEDVNLSSNAAARGRWPIIASVAVMALAVVAAGALWMARRPSPSASEAAPIRFEVPTPSRNAESGSFGLSPDGRRIVFIGTGVDGRFRMWERSLDSLDTRPISGSEGEVAANSTLFWSPDGNSIGFYSDGAVKRISRDGGVAEIVCKVGAVAVGGTWSPAGHIVVGNTGGGLVRCPADGGEATTVTQGGASGDASAARGLHLFPLFLRDGQRLLYFRVSRADPAGNGLYIADLRLPPDRQSQTRILETGFSARYAVTDDGDERILFVRNRGVWSVGFNSDRMSIEGEPVQVAESVYTFRDGASFDANGRVLVYRGGAPDYQLVWRNRSGDELATIGEPGSFVGMALSPDATRIALTRENKLNRSDQDLWIVDAGRNTTARFTSDPLPESAPAWSADGKSVVFAAGHDDANVIAKPVDGTAQAILLDGATIRPVAVNPLLGTFSASRDGRWLIFNVDTRGPRRSDIWILGVQPRRAAAPLIQEDFEQRQAVLSPDQRWVAHVSNESGADEVFIRPMTWPAEATPMAGAAVPVSRGGGRSPRWRGDSGELFFQSLTGQIMAAKISAKTVGEAAPLFAAPAALADWDVTSDGERFLLARPTIGGELPFTIVLNWTNR